MRTLLQRKRSHGCDAKAAREFRRRNALFHENERISFYHAMKVTYRSFIVNMVWWKVITTKYG